MCCTFSKSVMTNTQIYVGQASKNGKLVHLLAYQNKAVSNKPNAMVLPFPTDVAMSEDNIIDTSKFKNFLKDITHASQITTLSSNRNFNDALIGSSFAKSMPAKVFDIGSYTIILAENVNQIPEALTRVPEDKRPEVRLPFLKGYGKLYPNDPIAVCCWNGSIDAEPLMWWYEPRDPETLFIPTMDAHDEKAPLVGELVKTDHIISVGSTTGNRGNKVVYFRSKIPNDIKELLPNSAHGVKLPALMPNGDCFVKTASLQTNDDIYKNGQSPVELYRGYGGKMDITLSMNGWK